MHQLNFARLYPQRFRDMFLVSYSSVRNELKA